MKSSMSRAMLISAASSHCAPPSSRDIPTADHTTKPSTPKPTNFAAQA